MSIGMRSFRLAMCRDCDEGGQGPRGVATWRLIIHAAVETSLCKVAVNVNASFNTFISFVQ